MKLDPGAAALAAGEALLLAAGPWLTMTAIDGVLSGAGLWEGSAYLPASPHAALAALGGAYALTVAAAAALRGWRARRAESAARLGTGAAAVAAMMAIAPLLAGLAAVGALLAAGSRRVIERFAGPGASAFDRDDETAREFVRERLEAIEEVQLFGREAASLAQFEALDAARAESGSATCRSGALDALGLEASAALALGLTVVAAGYLAFDRQIGLGGFAACLQYGVLVFAALRGRRDEAVA